MLTLFRHRTKRKNFLDGGGRVTIISFGEDIGQECADEIFGIIDHPNIPYDLRLYDVPTMVHDTIIRISGKDRLVIVTTRRSNWKVRII